MSKSDLEEVGSEKQRNRKTESQETIKSGRQSELEELEQKKLDLMSNVFKAQPPRVPTP